MNRIKKDLISPDIYDMSHAFLPMYKILNKKQKIRAFASIRKRLKSICTLNLNLSFSTKIDRI